jgi:hypothetical protein
MTVEATSEGGAHRQGANATPQNTAQPRSLVNAWHQDPAPQGQRQGYSQHRPQVPDIVPAVRKCPIHAQRCHALPLPSSHASHKWRPALLEPGSLLHGHLEKPLGLVQWTCLDWFLWRRCAAGDLGHTSRKSAHICSLPCFLAAQAGTRSVPLLLRTAESEHAFIE